MNNSKRTYKDSLFRAFFSVPEHFAPLCNAVTGLNLRPDELEKRTVKEVLFNSLRNDVAFGTKGRWFIFFEHQSTQNFNMPLRMLFYTSLLYRGEVNDDLVYQIKPVTISTPKFFVFYNGREPCPEESTMKISDLFAEAGGDMELSVRVFNINYNKNFRLIRECRPIHDYSFFVNGVETRRANGMRRGDAILATMKECVEKDIMRDWVQEHKKEVFEVVNLWWDEEAAKQYYIRQGKEEGRAEGRAENALENIRNLMKNFKLSSEAAMNALGISPKMQKELAPLI